MPSLFYSTLDDEMWLLRHEQENLKTYHKLENLVGVLHFALDAGNLLIVQDSTIAKRIPLEQHRAWINQLPES